TCALPIFADVEAREMTVEIVDSDTPRVEIVQSGTGTKVSQDGETDSYQIVLTQQPTAAVYVRIAIQGQAIITNSVTVGSLASAAPGTIAEFDGAFYAVFDGSNWDQPLTVELAFDEDGMPLPSGLLPVAVQPHDLSRIAGPLFIEGGVGDTDRSLTRAVALPGERNPELVVVIDDDATGDVDQLVVFSDTMLGGLEGTLTHNHISGLGMRSDDLLVDFN